MDVKLPEGVHEMTMEQVRAMFVDAAPFTAEREEIWEAFETYISLLTKHLPKTRVIIDGSFVIHRDTQPPDDINFVVQLDLLAWARLPDETRNRLKHIRDSEDVLDAHFIPDWDERGRDVWIEHFSIHKDENRRRVPGVYKGVIEVKL